MDLKVLSPSVSLYYCNLLDALTEESVLQETATFLKHTRMEHGQKHELGYNK